MQECLALARDRQDRRLDRLAVRCRLPGGRQNQVALLQVRLAELSHDVVDGVWSNGREGCAVRLSRSSRSGGQHLAESGAPLISGELPGFAGRVAPAKFGDLILIG